MVINNTNLEVVMATALEFAMLDQLWALARGVRKATYRKDPKNA